MLIEGVVNGPLQLFVLLQIGEPAGNVEHAERPHPLLGTFQPSDLPLLSGRILITITEFPIQPVLQRFDARQQGNLKNLRGELSSPTPAKGAT